MTGNKDVLSILSTVKSMDLQFKTFDVHANLIFNIKIEAQIWKYFKFHWTWS
jgi:hypothetical protein